MSDDSVRFDEEREAREERGWRDMERRRIRRTRRTLIIVLAVLVILLLIASYWLVAIFKPAGQIATGEDAGGITWVRSIYGWGEGAGNQFLGPQGVTIGSDGTIWVTTQAQNRVVGFNPDGSVAAMLYQGPNTGDTAAQVFTYPTAVAVDGTGLVYIADQMRNTVWVVSRDNRIVRSLFVPSPTAIAVSGDRLVVGSDAGFIILTPAGSVVKLVGTRGKGVDQFDGVRGIAIGKDGTIFVVDQYNNRVSAYDRGGNRKWIMTTGNRGNRKAVSESMVATGSSAPAGMQIPAGLTIDGAGRLVIADPFGFDLTVLNAKTGKLIAKYGTAGTMDGQFVYPSSVAYDPARDWFAVADSQNGRVQIVRLPNSGATTVSNIRRTLSGPLRACCFPLLLIILVIIAGLIWRALQRRRERSGAARQGQLGAEHLANSETA